MNAVKLKETKSTYSNQWCFYTLTMNYLERRLLQHNLIHKNTNIGINLAKETKIGTLKIIKHR